MNRLALFLASCLLVASGCSSTKALTSLASNPLVSGIATATGLNPTQAAGGAGALLGLASAKLPAADWAKVAGGIPGTDALVSEGKKLGDIEGTPMSLSALSGTFTKLGISPEQAQVLVPAVIDQAEKIAGPEVGGLLRTALK